MGISYKPLWILLIKKDMTKSELREKAGISTRAMAKMGRGEDVNTDVLRKICGVLNCTLNDIAEIVPDEPEQQEAETEQATAWMKANVVSWKSHTADSVSGFEETYKSCVTKDNI